MTFRDRMLSNIRKDILTTISPELKQYIAEIQERLHPSSIKKVVFVEKFRSVESPIYEPDVFGIGLQIGNGRVTNIRLYQSISDLANAKNEIMIGIGEKIE